MPVAKMTQPYFKSIMVAKMYQIKCNIFQDKACDLVSLSITILWIPFLLITPGHFFFYFRLHLFLTIKCQRPPSLRPPCPPLRCGNERVQQEGPDIAEQRLCNQRPGAAGIGSQHRLLVVPGGGRHHASEPKCGHQDLAALGPLEGLLPGWWVMSLAGMLSSILPWWEVTTREKLRLVEQRDVRFLELQFWCIRHAAWRSGLLSQPHVLTVGHVSWVNAVHGMIVFPAVSLTWHFKLIVKTISTSCEKTKLKL